MPNEKVKVFSETPSVQNKYGMDNEIKTEKRKLFFSMFKRTKKDKNEKLNRVPFFQLFRFATKLDVLLMMIGTIGSLGNGACLPLMLIVFMNIFDSFTSNVTLNCKTTNASNSSNISNSSKISSVNSSLNSLTDQMKEQSLYLIYLGIATHVLSYLQVTFWLIASQRQTILIRKKLFKSILKQEIGWFDVYKTGELNNRLTEDVNKIREGVGDKCGNAIQYIATFIIALIIALVKGWQLTLVVLAISPLLFAASLLFTKSTGDLTNQELTAYAKAGSIAQEALTSIRTVFAFSGAKKEHERYVKNLNDAKYYGIKKGFLNGVLMGFLWLAMLCSYALGFWYGWYLTTQPNSGYTIGKILLVFFNILCGVFALGNAGPFFGTAASAQAAAYEVFLIIDRISSIDMTSKEGIKKEELIGDIHFENVKFNYPARPEIPILNALNLKIKSGITAALVGASGCGKSTCIQLLQRFYDPNQGQVRIDGVNIKDFNLAWLRSQIGVVNQEPILFGTTIAENIKFGKKDANMQQVEMAAKAANAHDFIMNLPDKYETLVGDRGGQLSGGQKQRIAIARALIRNPKILLLDEATSALDNESESIVQSALDKARLGRTTIIVAHRLSTIRNADIIFAFDKGVISEYGSHEDLMEQKGIYFNLVQTQQSNAIKKKTKKQEIKNETDDSDEGSDNESDELEENIEIPPEDVKMKSLSDIHMNIKKEENKEKEKQDKKKGFFSFLNKKKEEKKLKEKEPSLRRVLLMNRPEWGYILIGCIASVIAGGIQPAFGVVLAKAVGAFSDCDSSSEQSKIQTYCIIFIVFAVASLFAYIIEYGMYAVAGEELTKRFRSKAFKSILSQEIAWFDDSKNSVGVLTTKLAVEAAAVQGATGVRLGFILMNLSNLGVGIIISFAFSWPITLLIIAFIPFLVAGGAFQTKMLAGFSGHDKKNLEETGKITNESISNIRTVATLSKEDYFVDRYDKKIDLPHKEGVKTAHINGFILGLTTSVIYYAVAAAYSLGAYLIQENLFGMNLENIMLVFNCVLFGAQAVGQASAILPDYAKAKEAIKSMFDLFDRVPAMNNWEENSNGIEIKNADYDAKVELENVEFTFPSRKEAKILRGINLTIENGQKIALVGSSGCGKSTITQLLERFYDPNVGQVTLGNRDLKQYNLQWLRSQIGIVSQEPILFDLSIRENIAYGDNTRQVTNEEIISAAKKANIHDFITSLSNAYETNVGSKGTQLSGGQKQRIAIARALIRDPKILLLDEATSALDTESEKVVQDALDKAQEGRTCIIIAHRLSTIKNCDVIFVIKNGKVHEQGTHDQLISLNGFYKKLNCQYK